MTTYLGKSCSFGLPRVPFVNCRQFVYLVIFLLVLRAGCGIWLYQFLIIVYLFTLLCSDDGIEWLLILPLPISFWVASWESDRGSFSESLLKLLICNISFILTLSSQFVRLRYLWCNALWIFPWVLVTKKGFLIGLNIFISFAIHIIHT